VTVIKIFLVDDDIDILRLYTDLLTLKGFDIIGSARDGDEAIQFYEKSSQKPDIIIMDHRMPIKNGIEATKAILKIEPHTKIIFASADSSIEQEALAIGAVAFFHKPFNIVQLIEKIKALLEYN
jgi:two-component system chemotaxis response regulator CheY